MHVEHRQKKLTQRIVTTYLKTFKIILHKYRLTEKQTVRYISS